LCKRKGNRVDDFEFDTARATRQRGHVATCEILGGIQDNRHLYEMNIDEKLTLDKKCKWKQGTRERTRVALRKMETGQTPDH
jgi:hypothetical protein